MDWELIRRRAAAGAGDGDGRTGGRLAPGCNDRQPAGGQGRSGDGRCARCHHGRRRGRPAGADDSRTASTGRVSNGQQPGNPSRPGVCRAHGGQSWARSRHGPGRGPGPPVCRPGQATGQADQGGGYGASRQQPAAGPLRNGRTTGHRHAGERRSSCTAGSTGLVQGRAGRQEGGDRTGRYRPDQPGTCPVRGHALRPGYRTAGYRRILRQAQGQVGGQRRGHHRDRGRPRPQAQADPPEERRWRCLRRQQTAGRQPAGDPRRGGREGQPDRRRLRQGGHRCCGLQGVTGRNPGRAGPAALFDQPVGWPAG